MENHSRRDLFRVAAGAVAAVPVWAQGAAPLYFTPEEFRMVDELAEMIIPADEHSPGAHDAKVAAYLDKSFAEAFDEEPRATWRSGLRLINTLSQEMAGKSFVESTPEQKLGLLTRIAKNEEKPKKPEEIFFGEMKRQVARIYYSSKIGIHQEIGYLGNTMLNEFVGYDASLIQIAPVKSSNE